MTDRRIGGEGLNVDVQADPQRRVAAEGLTVDIAPVEARERQTDSLGLSVDVSVPLGVQYGHLASTVDFVPVHPTTRLGHLAFLVDYVPSLVLVDAVTWSGSAFGIGGAFPDVHWSGGQFQSGSGPRVLWQDDHFELEG